MSIEKRNEYISWREYFMLLAQVSALRSKDPRCQVGCCIVDPNNNKVISLGYNGFPRGIDDDIFPWSKNSNKYSEQKFAYVVHAELNAILNAGKALNGTHIYVTHFPCNECCKAIIQAGITDIFYLNEYDKGSESTTASINMMNAVKMNIHQIKKSDFDLVDYMDKYSKDRNI